MNSPLGDTEAIIGGIVARDLRGLGLCARNGSTSPAEVFLSAGYRCGGNRPIPKPSCSAPPRLRRARSLLPWGRAAREYIPSESIKNAAAVALTFSFRQPKGRLLNPTYGGDRCPNNREPAKRGRKKQAANNRPSPSALAQVQLRLSRPAPCGARPLSLFGLKQKQETESSFS